MKVHLRIPQSSRGLQRIHDALVRYLPASHKVVNRIEDADLVVLYAIGRRDRLERRCVDIWRRGKQYAIIQVCLRSTMTPRVDDWLQTPNEQLAAEGFEGIWQNCHVIWSYYDLNQACVDDGWSLEHDGDSMWSSWQFYHAPLGVDAELFYPRSEMPRHFLICSSGQSRLSESVRECALAAEALDRSVFHLGPWMPYSNVVSHDDLDDLQLATRYSMCEFVSGLRRKEGFELPAAEGLLCGSRPILFDSRDYRHWYEPWGEFIYEGTRQEVVDQLVNLFRKGARPVTKEEIEAARERFNWKTIIEEFWRRCS